MSPENWSQQSHALVFFWEGGSRSQCVGVVKGDGEVVRCFLFSASEVPAGPCHGHEVEISDELTADSTSRVERVKYVCYICSCGFFSHQRHC